MSNSERDGIKLFYCVMKEFSKEWMLEQISSGVSSREAMADLMITSVLEDFPNMSDTHVKVLVENRLDTCYDAAIELANQYANEQAEYQKEVDEARKGQY